MKSGKFLGIVTLTAGLCSVVACGGTNTSTPMASGGSGGSAGTPATTDPDTLLDPIEVTDAAPQVLGASLAKCHAPLTPNPALVRACVLATSCTPYLPVTSVSDCIELAVPSSGLMPACAAGALSCADIDACVGNGYYADACPVEAQFQSICVGTKVVNCGSFSRYYRDCAAEGATCARYSSLNDGVLDSADCAVPATCTVDSAMFTCNGSKRELCYQGVVFGGDCAAKGLACYDTASGAVCAADPLQCDTFGVGACVDAGKGQFCDYDGGVRTLDCAHLGLTCAAAPDKQFGIECVSPTCPATDAAGCFEECDGPMAHLCLAGHRFSVDCRDYGFQGCALDTRSTEGDRAACSMR